MHTPPHPHSHLSRVYLPDSNLTSRGSWAGGHGTLEVGRKQTIRPPSSRYLASSLEVTMGGVGGWREWRGVRARVR